MDDDVEAVRHMAQALTRVSGNVQRAQRRRPGASVLALLQTVAQADDVRPSDLAGHLGLSRGAVTRQVQQLVREGALTLSRDPGDGRSFFVELTPAGRERLTALDARGVQRFALFTRGWPVSEVRELGRLLEKLEASIAEAVRGDPPVTGAPWRRGGPSDPPIHHDHDHPPTTTATGPTP